MPNASKSEIKTYEVGYKGYYHEHSEWYTCLIRAMDQNKALRKFAKEHRIDYANKEPESWKWEEGEWFMAFRYIKEVSISSCPHCHGTGTVAVGREA